MEQRRAELKRRGSDVILGRRLFEIEQRSIFRHMTRLLIDVGIAADGHADRTAHRGAPKRTALVIADPVTS